MKRDVVGSLHHRGSLMAIVPPRFQGPVGHIMSSMLALLSSDMVNWHLTIRRYVVTKVPAQASLLNGCSGQGTRASCCRGGRGMRAVLAVLIGISKLKRPRLRDAIAC